ncbi:YqgE/AlgH family protein [Ferruginibacter sp.]
MQATFVAGFLFKIIMQLKAGTILISAPSLTDPHFEKAVILLVEYNEQGALGFVINKIFPKVFNELVEFKEAPAFPLLDGGPVENESLYFIHSRPADIDGGVQVKDDLYYGGNFTKAVELMKQHRISTNELKLLIGYCGWDAGELDAEIAEGSWLVTPADIRIIFTQPANDMWNQLYQAFH